MELTRPIEITITGRQFFNAADLFFTPKKHAENEEFFELPEACDRAVELATQGTLAVDGEGISLSYDESAITGLEGSHTTFTLSGDGIVTLSRHGQTKSHLVFEDGKRFQLFSDELTPPIFVQCHSLSHSLTPLGGKIDVDYSVEVAGSTVEHNSYTIRVNV
ncbi:MAG: DUF1934 domain-containing protein [Clostridia bacterium]|nr:DUF1934 domain-containing protein [Clostridia bacterium]